MAEGWRVVERLLIASHPIMRPVKFRVLHIAEVAVTLDQIALVQLDPSPKPVHPEWPHGLHVIVDQIQTFRHRFAGKAFHFHSRPPRPRVMRGVSRGPS
jgi:hypothetical protein